MKFKDIVGNFDPSKAVEADVSYYELGNELNVPIESYFYPDNNDIKSPLYNEINRLNGVYYTRWYCTDSYVGTIFYYLDRELVAISEQQGRKCDTTYIFINKELTQKLRDYLFQFVDYEEFDFEDLDYQDMDQELSEYYKIEYPSQVLQKKALYNGSHVDIIFDELKNKYNNYTKINIITNESTETINVRDLDFEYGS